METETNNQVQQHLETIRQCLNEAGKPRRKDAKEVLDKAKKAADALAAGQLSEKRLDAIGQVFQTLTEPRAAAKKQKWTEAIESLFALRDVQHSQHVQIPAGEEETENASATEAGSAENAVGGTSVAPARGTTTTDTTAKANAKALYIEHMLGMCLVLLRRHDTPQHEEHIAFVLDSMRTTGLWPTIPDLLQQGAKVLEGRDAAAKERDASKALAAVTAVPSALSGAPAPGTEPRATAPVQRASKKPAGRKEVAPPKPAKSKKRARVEEDDKAEEAEQARPPPKKRGGRVKGSKVINGKVIPPPH